ncbi:MAG TPA: restriction endonuclease subunit S, partial [Hyphomicrobiaceae bacterium]|nr:restriction endonuclease subunit S [Hyphomicrobiaceae bacterium]
MGKTWDSVLLGQVLRPALDPHKVDASRSYPNLGIYSFGRGVFQKPPIEGTNTSASTLYRVRAGQFIYSRLFAFEGAYALVPPDLCGSYVSNEFPTFDCDPQRLDAGYLSWLFRRPTLWRDIAARSTGMGDRRQRIHPEQVLAEAIPLPPLDEQRRIVARIDALAAKIAEARGLREGAGQEIGAVLPSAIDTIGAGDWPVVELHSVCDPERPITYGIVQAGEHIPDGVPYIRVSDMARPELTQVGMLRTAPWIAERYTRSAVITGDIVFAIRATIGKMRFVPAELNGANLTQGTARIAASADADPRYLYWELQSRAAIEAIEKASKGSTFREITLGRLRTIPVRLPPLHEQRRIVAELDSLPGGMGLTAWLN